MKRPTERVALLAFAGALAACTGIYVSQRSLAAQEIDGLEWAIGSYGILIENALQAKRDYPRIEEEIQDYTDGLERLERILPVYPECDAYLASASDRASSRGLEVVRAERIPLDYFRAPATIQLELRGDSAAISRFVHDTEASERLTAIKSVEHLGDSTVVSIRLLSGGAAPGMRSILHFPDRPANVWLPLFTTRISKLRRELQQVRGECESLAPFVEIAFLHQDRRKALQSKIDLINSLLPEGRDHLPDLPPGRQWKMNSSLALVHLATRA
jgi:hypothetical protein